MDKRRKIGKAKERKEKVKRGKDEEVNGQGGKKGAPAPHAAFLISISVVCRGITGSPNGNLVKCCVI